MHRATAGMGGRPTWPAAAERVVDDLIRHTTAPCGYASLKSVVTKVKSDHMPSYFLSETLKYLYLTFDDGNFLHGQGQEGWVFTTEAHPVRFVESLGDEEERRARELEFHTEHENRRMEKEHADSMAKARGWIAERVKLHSTLRANADALQHKLAKGTEWEAMFSAGKSEVITLKEKGGVKIADWNYRDKNEW